MNTVKPVCDICKKSFSSKQNLIKHIRCVHKVQNSSGSTLNSYYFCKENGCAIQCVSSKKLREHLTVAHNFQFLTYELQFENIEEFNCWKSTYEEKEDCNFSKSTGSKVLKNGEKKYYFSCHRSGTAKVQKNATRITQGSCKLGFSCTAGIILTEKTNGKINCVLFPDHYGHLKDIGKLRLTKHEKDQIAVKLSKKISEEDVLKEIREDFISKEKSSRIHLTNKQDLKNIKKKYALNGPVRHQDDATSVTLMLKDFEREAENPIIAYKFQGESGAGLLAELDINDVFFVIMHPVQKMIFKKFGMNTICVDSTHGTNRYGFILITLLVIDEYDEGFPVAFCLSNKEDGCSLKTFFSVIKNNLDCNIEAKVFMSDDASAFYNAWEYVFGAVEHKLLCWWHVERALRNKLQSFIKDSKLLEKVYKSIMLLLEETDEDEFNKLFDGIKDLFLHTNVQKFGTYFLKVYGNRMKEIAFCYRKNIGVNTNMHLESFHRVFKYDFLRAKTNNRIDMCLFQITEYIKNKGLDRVKKIERGKITYKLRQISARHKISMNLDFQLVNKEGGKYIVNSASNNIKYEVIVNQTNCDCKTKCQVCAYCIHEISCTCQDYLIRHILCKHCHLVLQKIKILETTSNLNDEIPDSITIEPELDNYVPELNEPEEIGETKEIHKQFGQKKNTLNDCNYLLKKISDQLLELNPDTDNEAIKKAYSMLNDVSNFLTVSVQKSENEKLPPVNDNNKIKVKSQRSFYSTKKQSVLKRKKLMKASSKEYELIRSEILNLDSCEENFSDLKDHSYCSEQKNTYTTNEEKQLKVLTKHQEKLLQKISNCQLHILFTKNELIDQSKLKNMDDIPDDIIDDDVSIISDLLSKECYEILKEIVEKKSENWSCSICPLATTKENMIECEICLKWSHFSCVGVKEATKTVQWVCKFCKGNC